MSLRKNFVELISELQVIMTIIRFPLIMYLPTWTSEFPSGKIMGNFKMEKNGGKCEVQSSSILSFVQSKNRCQKCGAKGATILAPRGKFSILRLSTNQDLVLWIIQKKGAAFLEFQKKNLDVWCPGSFPQHTHDWNFHIFPDTKWWNFPVIENLKMFEMRTNGGKSRRFSQKLFL